MQANIMKVKSCSEQFYVKSEKADNGPKTLTLWQSLATLPDASSTKAMWSSRPFGSLPVNTTVKFFKTS